MIIDSEKINIKNFVILLDDLMNFELFDFEACKIGCETICLNEYINLNDNLKAAFEYMQKEKQIESFSEYLKNIKKYNKTYNEFSRKGDEIARKERAKYGINIRKYYSDKDIQLPFGYSINDNSLYQMCHIFEYKNLKDLLIISLYNGDKVGVEKYRKMISDYENFIPLPEHIHRKFDRNYFTYNDNGELIVINEIGKEFVDAYKDTLEKFKVINRTFLSNQKIEYFRKRNSLING